MLLLTILLLIFHLPTPRSFVPYSSRRMALAFAIWVAVFAVAMGGTRILSRILIFNVGRDVEFDLRNRLLARLQILGSSFLQRMPTGETMSRAINDLAQVRAGTIKPLLDRTLPLSEAAEAHRLISTNQVAGNIVLLPWAE